MWRRHRYRVCIVLHIFSRGLLNMHHGHAFRFHSKMWWRTARLYRYGHRFVSDCRFVSYCRLFIGNGISMKTKPVCKLRTHASTWIMWCECLSSTSITQRPRAGMSHLRKKCDGRHAYLDYGGCFIKPDQRIHNRGRLDISLHNDVFVEL